MSHALSQVPHAIRRKAVHGWLLLKYRLFQRKRLDAVTLEQVCEHHVVVLPSVMNPVMFLTGKWFVEQLSAELIPPQSTVLDMGCGTGIVGIVAAKWAKRVVSADINPNAVRNATINTLLNRTEHSQTAIQSNLFDGLANEQFDVVLFNPPFFDGTPSTGFDQAWRTDNIPARLADQLKHHLTPSGYALILLSSIASTEMFLSPLRADDYTVETVSTEEVGRETLTLYKVQHVG